MRLLNEGIKDYKKYKNSEVLIYQMGKVGSSSLEKSIENSVHLHTLYANSPCWVGEEQRNSGIKRKMIRWIKLLSRRMALKASKEVKIITVVREPKERNISMFFQEFCYWMVSYINKYNPDMRYVDNDFIFDVFEKSFDHNYYDNWFDKEIYRLTGIDIFSMNFDAEKGIGVYKNGKYKLMVLKMEKIEENKAEIERFIGKEVDLKRVNDGGVKWYKDLYKDFKMRVEYKEMNSLKRVSNSKTARHFGY